MPQGNFASGDYFIDCTSASQSVIRAVFGVWINIWIAAIAVCIRSFHRSWVAHQLAVPLRDPQKNTGTRPISLWRVSPPATILELIQARGILIHSTEKGGLNLFYVAASLACVATAVISAASTTIANYAVVKHIVNREQMVGGRLMTREHSTLSGAVVSVTNRVHSLDNAGAPYNEVFDFIPDDESAWVYKAEQWNNSWKGSCEFRLYKAVDLTVFAVNSSVYQDLVPGLGAYLPQWTALDRTKQADTYTGFYTNARLNNSGSWQDLLGTYIFGNAPLNTGGQMPDNLNNVNIVLANFLAHHVGRDPRPDYLFQETTFKSDVHVAECNYSVVDVTKIGPDRARPDNGNYPNIVLNVAAINAESFTRASVAEKPVTQPTAQQMIRYWQAFSSVRDAQYPHDVQRVLAVAKPVVQLRLSILASTATLLIVALLAAVIGRLSEPLDAHRKRLGLPASQLDWSILAAREHYRSGDNDVVKSAGEYARTRDDLTLGVRITDGGQVDMCIASRVYQPDLPGKLA